MKRVTGHDLQGRAAGGIIHLINSGAASLDATGRQTANGQPAMKPFWEITPEEVTACLEATTWCPAVTEYFRGGGYSSQFLTVGGMPMTMSRLNLVAGLGPVLQIAEGWTVDLPEKVREALNERTNPTWPTHWFVPRVGTSGPFRDVYSVMENWGANHGSISSVTSGATSSLSPRCYGYRWGCTTFPKRKSSGRRLGPPSAIPTRRGPTSGPAPPSARCTGGSRLAAVPQDPLAVVLVRA